MKALILKQINTDDTNPCRALLKQHVTYNISVSSCLEDCSSLKFGCNPKEVRIRFEHGSYSQCLSPNLFKKLLREGYIKIVR